MKIPAILVLGSKATRVGDAAFDAGYAPVLRDSMLSALSALRKDRFHAVIVDCETASVDELEFVLNVRDVNATVPIYLVCGRRKPNLPAGLDRQRGVRLVGTDELAANLRPTWAKKQDEPGGRNHE